MRAEHVGIVVCDMRGKVIYGHDAHRALVPASTLKTLVAATSWFTLEPEYRFETKLVAGAAPQRGEIAGDVVLAGGGDPVLRSDDLRAAAGVLARAGLRHITGGVIVDASRFSGPEQNPLWLAEDLPFGFAAGTSALSVDQNTVEFRITPGAVGAPARVVLEPPGGSAAVSGTVLTSSPGSYNTLSIERGARANSFVVSGGIPQGAMQRYWRTIVDVPDYAGGVFTRMLAERGIRVDGATRAGAAPGAGVALWLHRSPPLRDLVRQMLVESNNHIAEHLLRTLGAECCRAGTEVAGAQAERAFLARRGLPIGGLRLVDGSGLSTADRISALTLAALLARVDAEDGDGSWVRAFPQMGREGTVKYRSLQAAAGRVRAKSGYLDGASGLVGYITTARHGRLTFAFIADDWNGGITRVFKSEDAMLDALAEF